MRRILLIERLNNPAPVVQAPASPAAPASSNAKTGAAKRKPATAARRRKA